MKLVRYTSLKDEFLFEIVLLDYFHGREPIPHAYG